MTGISVILSKCARFKEVNQRNIAFQMFCLINILFLSNILVSSGKFLKAVPQIKLDISVLKFFPLLAKFSRSLLFRYIRIDELRKRLAI